MKEGDIWDKNVKDYYGIPVKMVNGKNKENWLENVDIIQTLFN